ncbi:MAG: hypothetical protein WAM82_00725 [Thermoanaerobaculia bacterium]
MIYIDRNRLDDGGHPIRPDVNWFARARAVTIKALAEGAAHVVQESLYKDLSVKTALEELFHRKCAYCEMPLNEAWQVEHFRPKGAVAERPDHPGYYWLAYEWSNLYPSCAACNQRLEDKPLWEDPVPGEIAGKATQFPLEDEVNRAMSPSDDLSKERPLLLDPCSDRPEDCLLYDSEGEIEPTPGDLRAETSVLVFHLKRRRLRDRRKQHIELVVLLLKRLDRDRKVGASDAQEFEQDLERKIFADSSPFAGAARYVRSDPDAFGV